MRQLKYNRELYSKIALIKAAYNFTDRAYVHLDADQNYYYVSLNVKNEKEEISDAEFENEILAQSNESNDICKICYTYIWSLWVEPFYWKCIIFVTIGSDA